MMDSLVDFDPDSSLNKQNELIRVFSLYVSGFITKLTITLGRACHIMPKHINEQKLVSPTYERNYTQLIIVTITNEHTSITFTEIETSVLL